MIQVNIFWSFAMGGQFAAAAAPLLFGETSAIVNRFFIYTLLHLSLVFAPCEVYLIWQHTAWETMFFILNRSFHGIWAMLFAFTNVVPGIVGFLLVSSLIRQRRYFLATFCWTASYCIMHGILGLGYARMLYPGKAQQWSDGVEFTLDEFLNSQMASSLLFLGCVLLPPIFYPLLFWPRQGKRQSLCYHRSVMFHYIVSIFICATIGCLFYLAYVILVGVTFNWLPPLIGFLASQFGFGLIWGWPMLFWQQPITIKQD